MDRQQLLACWCELNQLLLKTEKQLRDYNVLYDKLEPYLDKSVPIMLSHPPMMCNLHSFGKITFNYSSLFIRNKRLALRYVTYHSIPEETVTPMGVIEAINDKTQVEIDLLALWKMTDELNSTLNSVESQVTKLRAALEAILPYQVVFTHEVFSFIKINPTLAYGSVSMGPITVLTDFEEVLKLCFQ